jgi:diketogulonate reductase-like aldo/keto reductase
MNRRDFLKVAVAAAAAPALLGGTSATGFDREMPYRRLGRTKEKVSIIGLGGGHLGGPTSDHESIEIVRTAIDNGVNFMDNCWDYCGGLSVVRMGKALRDGYR